MRSTHSDHLERWLGTAQVAGVSRSMRGWYGPPIAVGGVPGAVYATADGDFVGRCEAGQFTSAMDRVDAYLARMRREEQRRVLMRRGRKQLGMAGFTSLSDLVTQGRSGNRTDHLFYKATQGNVSLLHSLWVDSGTPAAGSAGAAAPGGTANDSSTTGAFLFRNPPGGDTTHFVESLVSCAVNLNTLLLYDRIFSVAKTMSSTATEAVTGVPTRYTSTTPGDQDYAGGNFVFPENRVTLGPTAHNWTVCQYTDQDGNTGVNFPSAAGISGGEAASTIDLGHWFMPLASGDTGVKALTQMQCSASVTGTLDFVIGHPIGWMPCIVANLMCASSGLRSALSMTRIFDNACLALLEPMQRQSTASPNYMGCFTTVSG